VSVLIGCLHEAKENRAVRLAGHGGVYDGALEGLSSIYPKRVTCLKFSSL
jgi:hypothetical protein